MPQQILIARCIVGERPLRHARERQFLDIVLFLCPTECCDDPINRLRRTGGKVITPVGIENGWSLFHRSRLQRWQLARQVTLDQDRPCWHPLDEFAEQLLPRRQAGIRNRANNRDLILRRHRKHARDQQLGPVRILPDHARHEANVNSGPLHIAEQAQRAHRAHNFGQPIRFGVGAIAVDEAQHVFGRGHRLLLDCDRLRLGRER